MFRILFGFEGRIGRRNYWLAIVSQWAILGGLSFAFSSALIGLMTMIGIDVSAAGNASDIEELAPSEMLFASGIGIASIVFLVIVIGMSIYMAVAAQVKRLHDMNMTGWLTTINFAALPIAMTLVASDPANTPIALFVMLIPFGMGLACGFFPGTVGANEYGADRISIFDGAARTDENWADRAQAHRAELRDQQEVRQSSEAGAGNGEPARKAKSRPASRTQAGGGGRKGFGKRGMA